MAFLWMSVPLLVAYAFATTLPSNLTLLVLIGVTISAPYTLITSTISADLGEHESLRGNQKAVATISGLVDGAGSCGAVVQGLLVPAFGRWFGWVSVCWLLTGCTAISALCITTLGLRELRIVMNKHQLL